MGRILSPPVDNWKTRPFTRVNRLKLLIGVLADRYSGSQPGLQTLVAPPPNFSPEIGSCFAICDGAIPL